MPKDEYRAQKARDKVNHFNAQRRNNRKPYWSEEKLMNSKIWFGKYKGKKFKEVPEEYLYWLAKNSPTSPGFILKLKEIFKISPFTKNNN